MPCSLIDVAGFELGMTVDQTLEALDERRLPGRVVVEYGTLSPTGQVARKTTERRSDVIPPRPARFVTVIETSSSERTDERDVESFRFDFALPPDDNVLLAVKRRARLLQDASSLVDEERLLEALREKYGASFVASPPLTGGPTREPRLLKWRFPEQARDCNPDYSRPSWEHLDGTWSALGVSSDSAVAPSLNCATSVIMKVSLVPSMESPIIDETLTTFGNDGEIMLNRQRHAAYRESLVRLPRDGRRTRFASTAL